MPDAAAIRAVQALGITPRAARRQVRRWARPEPIALSAAYYRDLARAQRQLSAQIRARLAAGADPDTLGPAVAAVVDRFADMIRSHGLAVLRWNARKYGTPLGVALGLAGSFLAGVRTDALDPDLESRVLESWTRENVALIKGANAQQVERITALTLRAARDGTRAADVEREIAEIMRSTIRRARLIARDQIGKLGGQLDRLKQTAAGVDAYVWRTVGDERVRGLHRQHNGVRYTWDAPPSDGHPGQPIQCRCTAEPDLSGVLGPEFAIDAPAVPKRAPKAPRPLKIPDAKRSLAGRLLDSVTSADTAGGRKAAVYRSLKRYALDDPQLFAAIYEQRTGVALTREAIRANYRDLVREVARSLGWQDVAVSPAELAAEIWYDGLAKRELTALSKWTEDGFAAIRNAMRSGSGKLRSTIETLDQALAKAPVYQGDAWRGMAVHREWLDNLRVGARIDDPAFTSYAKTRETALKFASDAASDAGGERVVLRARLTGRAAAHDIEVASELADEGEILLNRPSLRVESITRRDGVTYVDLTDV